MNTAAILLKGPKDLEIGTLALTAPGPTDVVVDVAHSGISTGTEKLFWSGDMPPFPGMGYPLVHGFEAAGEVVEDVALSGLLSGYRVFVTGANCFEGAFG
ncbi:MAG: chlorophyll synthesis pathway protein BchC, partial [Pseudomonadota bacterium]